MVVVEVEVKVVVWVITSAVAEVARRPRATKAEQDIGLRIAIVDAIGGEDDMVGAICLLGMRYVLFGGDQNNTAHLGVAGLFCLRWDCLETRRAIAP